MPSAEFISEPLKPDRLTFDAAAMATGVPGLPTGFQWRDQHFEIATVESSWKECEPCTHGSAERYLRKHFWKLRTKSGEVLTVYALRKVKRGENPKARWWLYTIGQPASAATRDQSA